MRLVVYCKKCSTRNPLKIRAGDRVELKMKYGDAIDLTCKNCNAKNKYRIDDIKAEQKFGSLISFIIVLILMILGVYFLWDYAMHKLSSPYLIPIGLLVLLFIYIVINKEMNAKVRNFNRS